VAQGRADAEAAIGQGERAPPADGLAPGPDPADDGLACPRIDCRRSQRCLHEPCALHQPPPDPY
jgi:hypothetical protein